MIMVNANGVEKLLRRNEGEPLDLGATSIKTGNRIRTDSSLPIVWHTYETPIKLGA